MSGASAALHHRGMEEFAVSEDGCPTAPSPAVTVHTRVLHRACQVLGGVDQLAEHLRVSKTMLRRWLEGEDVPPSVVFLKAVDLIVPPWGPADDAHAESIRLRKN